MKRILAALLALALNTPALSRPVIEDGPLRVGPSYVDPQDMQWIASDESGFVLLSNLPCKHPAVVKRIRPEFRADFRAGIIAPKGQAALPICYDAVDMGEHVTIIGPNGPMVKVPMHVFTLLSRT